ncbi:hypothetical protein [Aeoliella sp.]|uniref:hypothetical protein n=1 Tax=Aeoliella sp. TaxID=2795800 RepID=UPI003CCBAB9A
MSSSPSRIFLLGVILTIAAVLPAEAWGQREVDYETIRFYTKNSKPEQVNAYAFSPNGRYLALSFNSRNTGSKSGVSIVDLKNQELVGQTGSFSFFTLAFSSDSSKVAGIGNYAGFQRIDVQSLRGQKLNVPDVQGKIGISLEEKNGKLLITKVDAESNPTIDDQLRVGDEVLAINAGEKPTRYDDSREWQMIAGKSLKKALEAMKGKPGTWVQLRLSRRGKSEPIDISVQRQWPAGTKPKLPNSNESLARSLSRGALQFLSADTMQMVAFISLRDLKQRGQFAISPNARLFGALSQPVNGREFCVEVHNLATGKLKRSTILDVNNYRHLRFSPDSTQILVGTRDTIEVYDIEQDQWLDPVVLTPPEDADAGRVVNRRIPLGLGLPGDLYTTSREVVYSKPASLALFDVSPHGTLAVGSETGEIVMASLESKERVGLIGDNILGAKPEMIEFSPTGGHMVAFAKGVLHIFELDEGAANSEVVDDEAVLAPAASQ